MFVIPHVPRKFFDTYSRKTKTNYSKYKVSNLDPDQIQFYNVISSKIEKCCLLQSGPGSGKTFTLITIAENFDKNVTVVIFKNDSLEPFQGICSTASNAKFFMLLFKMPYMMFKNLSNNLTFNLNPMEITFAVIEFLKIADLTYFSNNLMIFDEYTVIPKTLLFVILILFNHYKIQTIFSGDKHQLQSIENKKSEISSFNMVKLFSKKSYEFSINHRCSNEKYNIFINHLSKFSSTNLMDFYIEALITAMFYKQMINNNQTSDELKNIIMAAHHSVISKELSNLLSKYNTPVSYYWIKPPKQYSESVSNYMRRYLLNNNFYLTPAGASYSSKSRLFNLIQNKINLESSKQSANAEQIEYIDRQLTLIKNSLIETYIEIYGRRPDDDETITPVEIEEKFLPFIPLIEGGKYFYEHFSESNIVILEKIVMKPNELYQEVDHLTIREKDSFKSKDIFIKKCDDVTFSEHKNFLVNLPSQFNHEKSGSLLNFNIYPANIMTLYMAQGRTISDKINLILTKNTTNQAIYVGFSRVNDPSQFAKISTPHQFEMLLSLIINFPELLDPTYELDPEFIIERLSNNYKLYYVENEHMRVANYNLSLFFVTSHENRKTIYQGFLKIIKLKQIIKPIVDDVLESNNIYEQMFNYKELLMSLSFLETLDARVWLMEYSKFDLGVKNLMETPSAMSTSTLYKRFDFQNLNILKNSTHEYIKILAVHKLMKTLSKEYIENCFLEYSDETELYGLFTTNCFVKNIYNLSKKNKLSKNVLEKMLVDALKEINLVYSKQPKKDPSDYITPIKRKKENIVA